MPNYILKSLITFAFCVCSFLVKGQLTAGFTVDDTAGCAPLVVHFHNTSTGATSYSWNLGDGSPLLTLTDVSNGYTGVGTYTVTLTAYSGTSSSTYSAIIRVYSIPTVNFSVTDTSVCPGAPVTFTSSSTSGAWGGLTYTWNFGDGGTGSSASQAYSYASPGFYNVTLYATNVKGCPNSFTRYGYMHIFTPASIGFGISSSILCKAPGSVTFSNTTTGSGPFSYVWKFGDGGSSTTTSPSHTYSVPGSYTLSLKVTDHNGCVDSVVLPSSVSVGNLAAAFTSVSTACANSPVTFNNTSTAHISSQWSFGDGGTSSSETGVYSYCVAGTYSVRLIAYNGGTCYDTITHSITIVPSPTGSFAITPTQPCPPPTALTFTGTVPSGCTVAWVFSDGTAGSGTPFVHTYPYSEIYTTAMIITNSSGCKDTVVKKDTLYNLRLSMSSSYPFSGCAPLVVNFSSYDYSVVFDPSGPDSLYLSYPYPVTGYSWNFGDGSPSSTSPTPIHSYTAAGVYTATCLITTSNGCTATTTAVFKVGVPSTTSFTAAPRHVCADKTTTFTSTSTGTIDFYDWSFGDGGSLAGGTYATVVHIDSIPGVHTVTLITYYNTCPGTGFSLTDSVDSPKAVIHYSYTCIPENGINFTDASYGDNSHLWLFGDATTSTALNPVHFYPSLTGYSVKLATYNIASGCRDTATSFISLAPPFMSLYTLDSTRICPNKTNTFYSTIAGFTPVSNYRWYDNGGLFDSSGPIVLRDFLVRGEHTITLVVKDNRTCLDTFAMTNYILVGKPIDTFSFTPTAGCAPVTINFSDHSTDVAGTSINHYFWSFGDGDTTSVGVPTIAHSYTANGTYHVEEIVKDNISPGCADTGSIATIIINKPSASFSVSGTTVCTNTSVHFTNTSTGYTNSSWSFGDGVVSTVTSPTHVYSVSGVYSVKLVVFSSLGCSDSLVYLSYITVNPAPHASFYMDDSFAICPPLNVSFFNTSTGAASYYWSLGDSTHSVAATPGDIYHTPGLYTIILTAISSNGCTDTAIGHAKIFGYSGAFTYSPLSGCVPLNVHFSATLTSAASIIWDFNDGVTSAFSTSDTISHTYHAAGAYVPKLILTDSSHCSSYSLGTDTIKVDTVIPNFITVPSPACLNSSIAFHDTTISYFSTIASRLWTFAPGVTSGATVPVYTYTVSGVHPVTLSVTNGHGCVGTITKNVTVNPPPGPITGVFSVCSGSTTSLTDAGGGTWSTSGSPSIATVGSTSGVVTGITSGIASVTYTSPTTGCSVTATVNVYPSPGTIGGSNSVCTGNSITLTDTTAGGSWSSSDASIATVGTSSGIVTGMTAGIATITYSFTATCFETKTVTVNISSGSISGPSTVCVGITASETDGVPGGSWSSSNPAAATVGSGSGVVTGVAIGTTVLTYSISGGCPVTKPVTVNPSIAHIGGAMTVCTGSTTTLSDATSGGTWSSSALGTATVNSTGVVTGVLAGTVTISYTVGGATGCSATAIVTVNSTPVPISGPATVCAHDSITETDAVTGGAWSSSNLLIATVGSATGVVSGVSGGATVISYITGVGCYTIKTVTVNPISLITGLTAVCAGHTTTLSDATAGGTWSSSDLSVATITSVSGVLTSLTRGTTTITYLLSSGCSATAVVTVNLAPDPIAGATSVCKGSTALLIDGGGGTWSSGSAGIATVGSSTGIISGVALGASVITYSLGFGCSVTATITVNAAPSSISGATVLCMGASTTLTDPTPGGTWSTYDSGIATAGSTSGSVTGILPGRDTIIYTISTGCAAKVAFTVNPLPSAITGAAIICLGTSTTFTDSTTGGAWSSSNPAVASVVPAGTVTGGSSGTAIITYSLPTGCRATKVISVNLSPEPISGVTNVCKGSTTSLSDLATGGVWSIGAAGSGIASVTGTGVVSGIAAGTAIITYSLGASCITHATVTINPLPGLIDGPTSVCAGSAITLADTSVSGSWTSSNPSIATTGTITGVVTGASSGTVTISYTLATTCTATQLITVNPAPPLPTGTLQVCAGLTTSLSDVVPGGTWTTSDITTATVTGSGVVSGILADTVTISYTHGGCPSSVIVTVNPLPGPITGSTFLCIFLPSTLSDTGGGTWSTPSGVGIVSIIAATGSITGTTLGTASVTYTLPTGCITSTIVTVNPIPSPVIGPTSMCVGESIILSDLTSGGVWSSGTPTVGTVIPVSGGMAIATGVSGGTVPISYTEAGCPAIATIIVNPLPGPITGITSICAFGDTMQVYDSVVGGLWSSTLAPISTTGVITGFASGTAIVTYTLVTGCRVTDTFFVNPVPALITGGNHLCVGLTASLFDTTTGGIWSISPAGIASVSPAGLVTGLTTGTAVVRYTLPVTGCRRTDTVGVSPLPSPIGGIASVCNGVSTTLTDTSSGGIWSSSNTAIATAGISSGVITGVSAGTATITYYLGAGCMVVRAFTVNPLPIVYTITGGGNYCSGTGGVHIGLTGSDTGITYRLYDGTTLSGTIAGTGVAADFGLETAAGIYKAVASSTATACSKNMADSAIVTITPSVVPLITMAVSPGALVCAGTPVAYVASSVNGGLSPVYQWTINTSVTGATSSSYSYTPVNNDVVTVTLISSAPCAIPDTVSNAITMTVDSLLIPSVSITATPGINIKPGQSDTFNAVVTNGGPSPAYQWEIDGVAIAGATTAAFISTFGNSDTVTCVVSAGGVCNSQGSGWVLITVSNVGVTAAPGLLQGEVSILPNPNNGEFIIRGSLGTLNDEDVSLEITDMLGQAVYKDKITAQGGKLNERIRLNSALANGMYMLNLRSTSGNKVFHIVKER